MARWLRNKEKVHFSSCEDMGSEAPVSWRAQKIGKTPVLQWEMAASPAWKIAMEDRAALDLCGSHSEQWGSRHKTGQSFVRVTF